MSTIIMSSFHIFLLLISITFSIFDKLHATETTDGSLVLGLTLSTPTTTIPTSRYSFNKKTSNKDLDGNMIEPLQEIGEGYTLSLSLGTPPQQIQLFFDTGSDLIAVPCNKLTFQCIDCKRFHTDYVSFFHTKSSSTISLDICSSPFCRDVHMSDNPYDACAARCPLKSVFELNCILPCPPFAYNYAGGAVVGQLSVDNLSVNPSSHNNNNLTKKMIHFGCLGAANLWPIGNVGFGKGLLSLPSQLGFSKNGFSHCFLPFKYASNPNFSSPLIIGDQAISSKENLQYTPMINNPLNKNSYYIGLESVTVGSKPAIAAPVNLREFNASSGHGGMLMDSGTTYTLFSEPLYSQILNTLESVMNYTRAKDVENSFWPQLCYEIPIDTDNNFIPSITFNFLNNVSLTLPQETCFCRKRKPTKTSEVKCLMFQKMGDDESSAAVFGNFQQHNMEVVYDLKNRRIGFLPTDCLLQAKSHGLQN